MSAQRQAFDPGPATGGLGIRQQLVLEILTEHPDGLRTIDVGAQLHQRRNTPCGCGPGRICKWATGDASDVLRALRKKELAIQRRVSGRWELMHPPVSGYDPSNSDIPF